MGTGHSHGPSISAGGAHRRQLLIVLALTTTVLIAEVIGGWITGSLALLADAGHMFTDVAGITLAILAVTYASRPATDERTYGYYRLEILAAVINAVLLFGVAVFILVEAWRRWTNPPEVQGGLMLAFAAVGLVANVIGLFLLRSGSKASLNVKGAYLEVLGDTLGSLAVIAAAIIIATTGWQRADVVASVAVALMILPRTWSLLREATDVLLEAAPKGTDPPRSASILTSPAFPTPTTCTVWTHLRHPCHCPSTSSSTTPSSPPTVEDKSRRAGDPRPPLRRGAARSSSNRWVTSTSTRPTSRDRGSAAACATHRIDWLRHLRVPPFRLGLGA
jgi:cobalt-zinc-cadmium efflux system protein